MTVSDLVQYFGDRELFTDPGQEVRFTLSSEGVSLEKGEEIEMRGSAVPERGRVTVAFRRPATKRFMFSLKFEANPVIEAKSLEEAERMAYDMMRDVGVTRQTTPGIFEDMPEYVAQEPCFLEEVKG